MAEFEIAFYGKEFLNKHMELMATSFPQEAVERKLGAWDWMFAAPFQDEGVTTRVMVVEKQGEPVGGLLLLASKVVVKGKTLPSTSPILAVVHPDHRGAGSNMFEHFLAGGWNYGLLWALPNSMRFINSNVRLGALGSPPRMLRRKVYQAGSILAASGRMSSALAKPVDLIGRAPVAALSVQKPKLRPDEQIEEIAEFGPEFDQAWETVRPGIAFAQTRESRHLKWRFIDMPLRSYTIWALRRGGKLAGYVAVLVDETDKGRVGRIVDFYSYDWNTRDFALLFAQADGFFQQQGCNSGEISFAHHAEIDDAARRCGFFLKKESRPFIAFHKDGPQFKEVLKTLPQAHFTRGDQDEDF